MEEVKDDDFSSSVVIRRSAFSRALGRVEYFDFFFGGGLEIAEEEGGGGGERFLEVDGCVRLVDGGIDCGCGGFGFGSTLSDVRGSTAEEGYSFRLLCSMRGSI